MDSSRVLKMFAPVAALVIILFTLAASLNAQVDESGLHYASDDNFAQTDDNSSDDKSEQKRTSEQTDRGTIKKVSKKKDNVCVGNCPDVWRPYQLTPWPVDELRKSI
jgi:hypothetical protein